MSFDNPLTGADRPGWRLRMAAVGDAAALALVGRATFLDTYAGSLAGDDIVAHCDRRHAEHVYACWLADARYALWLVEAPGGAPVGYQVTGPPDMTPFPALPDDVELKRLYLLGRHQGGGAGAAMMKAAIGHARERRAGRLLVALWSENRRAMAFYRRWHFAEVGTRPFTVGATTHVDPVLALPL